MSEDIKRHPWRPRKFETAQDLYDTAQRYFYYCDTNPIKQIDFRGKDAQKVELEHKQPYSIAGFCVFAGITRSHMAMLKKRYEESQVPEDKEFLIVIAHIEDVCYHQKFNGALVGMYKENIVARDLGLMERTDHTTKGEKVEFPTELKIIRVNPKE